MSDIQINPNIVEAAGATRVPRYTVDFPLAATIHNGTPPVRGKAVNISIEGIGAIMMGELPDAHIVTLSFVLPFVHEDVHVRAFVRHRDGYNVGFEFLGLSEDDREAIDRMSERLHMAV